MANKKVYEVEVAGTDKAATTLRAFEDTFAKGGVAAAKSFGDVFKGLSRDIDVIGGQVTAGATKAISDVLGIAEAVGSGGVLGPIALVSAAVGGVVALVGQWKREEQELEEKAAAVAKAHQRAADDARKMADALAAGFLRVNKAISDQDIAQQNATITARGLVQAQLIGEAGILRARAATALHTERDVAKHLDLTKEAEAARVRAAEFATATAAMVRARDLDLEKQVRAEQREMDRERARESAAAYEKAETAKAARAQQTADFYAAALARMAEADARRKAQQDKDGEDYEQQQRASAAALEALQAEDAAAGSANEIKRQEEEMKLEKERIDLLTDRKQKEIELARALEERARAQLSVNAETQIGTSVNMAYGASTMVLNAMMQPLIQTLQVYGTVNRENWRDLLAFTEDSKAAFAAQVQTALWSLAMQAGQKSIFEVGEQYREQALSLGALATGNFVGASVHMMSAAQHGVASTVYAGIAGASAGASVGVGMTRGEGGLFGLTKEERERKERDRGGGETRMPGQGGPAARGGGGGSDGPVVVNFVYEAGAIDARSRDAAAATVAEASRHARRSGFTSRMMRA